MEMTTTRSAEVLSVPNVPSVGVPDDTDKTATITQIDIASQWQHQYRKAIIRVGKGNTTPDVQNVSHRFAHEH